MFDIGFWELILIAIIVLVVIGPERLPKVARTAGLWVGQARRMAANMRAEIKREIAAEELKETLTRQADTTPVHDIIEETRQVAEEVKGTLKETVAPDAPTDTREPSRDGTGKPD